MKKVNINLNYIAMKRIVTIFAAIILAAVSASAQKSADNRDDAPHFYTSTEFNIIGADFQGFGKSDFGAYGFTVSPGYRFNKHWAVFVPITTDILLLNRQSTRNFVEQGTMGLGGSYTLTMKDNMAIEFALSGSSTYLKSDLNYFKTKAVVNFGFHSLTSAPYIGVGCSYMSPYDNAVNDKVMLEVNIGFTLF